MPENRDTLQIRGLDNSNSSPSTRPKSREGWTSEDYWRDATRFTSRGGHPPKTDRGSQGSDSTNRGHLNTLDHSNNDTSQKMSLRGGGSESSVRVPGGIDPDKTGQTSFLTDFERMRLPSHRGKRIEQYDQLYTRRCRQFDKLINLVDPNDKKKYRRPYVHNNREYANARGKATDQNHLKSIFGIKRSENAEKEINKGETRMKSAITQLETMITELEQNLHEQQKLPQAAEHQQTTAESSELPQPPQTKQGKKRLGSQFEDLHQIHTKLLKELSKDLKSEKSHEYYKEQQTKFKEAFNTASDNQDRDGMNEAINDLTKSVETLQNKKLQKDYKKQCNSYKSLIWKVLEGRREGYEDKSSKIQTENIEERNRELAEILEEMILDARADKAEGLSLSQKDALSQMRNIADIKSVDMQNRTRQAVTSFLDNTQRFHSEEIFAPTIEESIKAQENKQRTVRDMCHFAVMSLGLDPVSMPDLFEIQDETFREELLEEWQNTKTSEPTQQSTSGIGKEPQYTAPWGKVTTSPELSQFYRGFEEQPEPYDLSLTGMSKGKKRTEGLGELDPAWQQPSDLIDTPFEVKYKAAIPLLESFETCFPEAAKLIQRYERYTMKLVTEAAEAGITFIGYSEGALAHEMHKGFYARGGHKDGKVYVTEKETDPILAMRHFLFELTNGISNPAISKVKKQAHEARWSQLTSEEYTIKSKEYAYKKVAIEAEGTRRIAKIWMDLKPQMEKDGFEDLGKHDQSFWIKSLNQEKEAYIKDLLGRKYTRGPLKGKTMEENYMRQFDEEDLYEGS